MTHPLNPCAAAIGGLVRLAGGAAFTDPGVMDMTSREGRELFARIDLAKDTLEVVRSIDYAGLDPLTETEVEAMGRLNLAAEQGGVLAEDIRWLLYRYATGIASRFALTDEAVEAACRAHDAEDSACRGEPSPWDFATGDSDFPRFREERLSAMRQAFITAGLGRLPTGFELALIAMNVPTADQVAIRRVLDQVIRSNRLGADEWRDLAEYLPGILTASADGYGLSKASFVESVRAGLIEGRDWYRRTNERLGEAFRQ